MATRTIAVIGSLNIDFITRTSRIPEPGETLTATSFDSGFGGKVLSLQVLRWVMLFP